MDVQQAPFFDALETRDPAVRERAQFAALPGLIEHARAHAPAWAARLAGVDARGVVDLAALARLPVLRKGELLQAQRDGLVSDASGDPFGGFSAIGWGVARRVFQSPGPIYEPEGPAADHWRAARALWAAGFRAGELVHNSFSYHLTPAGHMMEAGALAIGCTVLPAGVGNTELQVQALRELRPSGYVGTPSFLRILVEKAQALSPAPLSLRHALVSGEAFPVALRDLLRQQGIEAFQCYATADLGLIAYETSAREGLVVDEGVIVEIVRPGTGDPLPEGEVGEVVVTSLNRDYPLIRFGTGDLSAVLPGPCPTGRTNQRIRGWLGRADQTTKVRGMFVHPSQVADVARRHPEVLRARLVVSGEMARDELALLVEVAAVAEMANMPEGLAERLAESVREVTKLRAEVRLCVPGTLPNDGRVIADERPV